MIGHDIVFLPTAISTGNHLNIRWLEKVFTPIEISFIRESERPETVCWKLWAAKESIYKLELQLGNERAFSPKKILSPEMLDKLLKHPENPLRKVSLGSFKLHIKKANNFILAFAFCPVEPFEWAVFESPAQLKKERSRRLRSFLSARLSDIFGWDEKLVSFEKNEKGIPLCVYKGSKQNLSISFSHDGPLLSYAFLSANDKVRTILEDSFYLCGTTIFSDNDQSNIRASSFI